MPDEPYDENRAGVAPVSVVTVPALIVPVVKPSSLFSDDAVAVVSLSVTASLPSPLMPEEAYAADTAAIVPVSVVTDAALTVPVVKPSSVFNDAAASVV